MIEAVAIQTKDGRVWTAPRPLRHDACFNVISQELQIKEGDAEDHQRWVDYMRGHTQGFVTTGGKFLDRHEALLHARTFCQLLRPHLLGSVLTSEDLWALTFDKALKFLRDGFRLMRYGWSNSDVWVVLQKGYPNGIPINKNTAEVTRFPEGSVCRFAPYFMIYGDDGMFRPWTPTQEDILADDWDFAFSEDRAEASR